MQILKKISNWTLGGMFRTIGRILAYIIIGLIISLLLMKSDKNILRKILGVEKVMAASISTSSDQYLVQTCSGPSVCDYTIGGSTYNTGYINRNTQFQNNHGPSSSEQFVTSIRLRQQFNSSNYLQSGVTYTIRYKFNFDSKMYSYRKPASKWTYTLSAINSSSSSFDISTNDYMISFSDITNDMYGFYITIVYTPNQTLRQVSLQLKFPYSQTYDFGEGPTTLYQEQLWALNYKTLSITSNQDNSTTDAINNQTVIIERQTEMINETITELEDTITSEDSNPESKKCGIICKLKHIVSFLKVENLINIIIPTEEQMEDLFDQFQEGITEKLGILGLPVTVYTNIMHLVDNTTENNWCFSWDGVEVPNFENYTIIQAGQYCFNDMLSNNKIKALRDFSITFSGALILLAFIQFLKNMLHRVLDVPDRDEYTYFTQEDVYTINNETGEVTGHQVKNRSTYREVR